MNKETLKDNFKNARETNAEYVFVAIKLPDTEIPEMIINRKENFDVKEKFYLDSYDDDLKHNHNKEIKITGLAYGNLDTLKNIY